eukprot:TRINITY_DN10986_c0_g1_i1.p2 TRINITY_DN10986_c0_g1~~TRINITY_DN10986_c0_g1_i1.p2  ORF type:complete len:105 (-),score=7.05 TRINITY_DN10986_c0_g1_i1:421-735(-)
MGGMKVSITLAKRASLGPKLETTIENSTIVFPATGSTPPKIRLFVILKSANRVTFCNVDALLLLRFGSVGSEIVAKFVKYPTALDKNVPEILNVSEWVFVRLMF